MAQLLDLTLLELASLLQTKRASPVELLREVMTRMDQQNPTLLAVVAQRDPDALLAEARAAEERISAGQARPLEGIPFGVKDLENVAGLVTSHGSTPYRDNVAHRDSTQVARLKKAGAIVFGKTNAPEFGGMALTKNLLFGVTRSPWNPDRTPGGSSGGSAAALAGEMLPLVTASDGGGSIRIPASFVGAFGLKTSFGRIPIGPLEEWDYGATNVVGPLTKTVEDAALFLDQVVGFDVHDPRSLPHPGISYLEVVRQPLDRKLKIAYSPDLGYAAVQSDILAAVQEAARVFEKLGHHVESLAVGGGLQDLGGDWGLLNAYETGARIAHLRPEHDAEFSRVLIEAIRFAEGMSQNVWARLSHARVRLVEWCADIFSRYDLLLTPTVPCDPPAAKGPFPVEIEGRAMPTSGAGSFTIPFNLSWHPAASVRAGFSQAGFPVGLQIVGPHHRDDLVLQAARAFEQERPWHPHWPMRG